MRKVEGWEKLKTLWLLAGEWKNDKGEAEIVDWAKGPFMRYIKPEQWLDFMQVTAYAVRAVCVGNVDRKYLGVLSTWISKGRWMESQWEVREEEELPDLNSNLSNYLTTARRTS